MLRCGAKFLPLAPDPWPLTPGSRPFRFDPDQYLDYVQGYNLTNRMPLFVKPKVVPLPPPHRPT